MDESGVGLDQLDAIIFGQGPGSFTGLRIAAGVVQGLAYGLQVPVVPVSSMACLAHSVLESDPGLRVAVAMKARLQEVYFGTYVLDDGAVSPLGPEMVVDVDAAPRQEGGQWRGVGDGWEFRAALERSLGVAIDHVSPVICPTVNNLLVIGQHKLAGNEAVSALNAIPEYLREQVAHKGGGSKGF